MRKGINKVSGQIRVIGGKHRGRKLPVMDVQGLRPTTDRQKETLFNWLMADTAHARCLDVFAGAGALGIEALSRGAKQVVFIEKDKSAATQIQTNLDTLGLDLQSAIVVKGDALKQIASHPSIVSESFDIIFIDPPFNNALVQVSIDLLCEHISFNEGAKIYIEAEIGLVPCRVPANWQLIKQGKSSQTNTSLYRYNKPPTG